MSLATKLKIKYNFKQTFTLFFLLQFHNCLSITDNVFLTVSEEILILPMWVWEELWPMTDLNLGFNQQDSGKHLDYQSLINRSIIWMKTFDETSVSVAILFQWISSKKIQTWFKLWMTVNFMTGATWNKLTVQTIVKSRMYITIF